MAALTVSPALSNLVATTPDVWQGIANFIVDNNPSGVTAVLKANGYVYNTNGEAAIIVKSILIGTDAKSKSVLAQLSKVPYLNDNTNGTGGLKGPVGLPTTQGIGDDLVCTVGTLFGYPIGCTGSNLTPEQLAQQQAAALAAQQQKTRTNIIIASIIGGVILIVAVIYFSNQNKSKNKSNS